MKNIKKNVFLHFIRKKNVETTKADQVEKNEGEEKRKKNKMFMLFEALFVQIPLLQAQQVNFRFLLFLDDFIRIVFLSLRERK